jgi:F-type H+-transporting ATPase subunit b
VRAAAALRETAIADAQGLALTIAGELLARLDSRATDAAFLGWLVQGITAMPEADRRTLADAGLELVSATDPDTAAQERIAHAIASALGSPADLTFRTDPALIAGLELHSPHFTLRNSWRADLARIAVALGAQHKDLTDAA